MNTFKVLAGNVRYLEISSFDWAGPESDAAWKAAMGLLKDGDAVIIDLRRNGGGSGRAVHELISHFVKPNTPLISFRKGHEASPMMSSLDGLSDMIGKPLYVLTSGHTGSAAEEFVGHVAGYKLGEVVGETTSGGAYKNAVFPIQGRFELSVSVARPVLAATGTDWEGAGIAPTIPAPAERALTAAHLHAVTKLGGRSNGARTNYWKSLTAGLQALLQPPSAGAPLTTYAGSFQDRTFSVVDGKLWYTQGKRLRREMTPLGTHEFILTDDPSMRIVFDVEAGRARAVTIVSASTESQVVFERASQLH